MRRFRSTESTPETLRRCFVVYAAMFLVSGVRTAPVITSSDDAILYLKKYGHMDDTMDTGSGLPPKEALQSFQHIAGVAQTGELDEDTVTMMNKKRCEVPDNVGAGSAAKRRRRRRYVVEGSQWPSTALQYAFINYTQQLPLDVVQSTVQQAFQFWANVTPLTFTEGPYANIRILYARLAHGDAYPFTGAGPGVLAHAFFPDSGGQAHFNNDETWTLGTNDGTNLLQVTTHELGHTLGLAHSTVTTAVMAPFYSGYTPNFALTQDDINGIQYLYGPPPVKVAIPVAPAAVIQPQPNIPTPIANGTPPVAKGTPPTTAAQLPVSQPNICANPAVDAMVVAFGTTYAFQGLYYYGVNSDATGFLAGYPALISKTWPQITGAIDTALYTDAVMAFDANGKLVQVDAAHLYIFQGYYYWKFDNLNQPSTSPPGVTYPQLISVGFPGLPSPLDAAFFWSGNGLLYFVQGAYYYRYTMNVGTDVGYPKPLSVWTGVPWQGINSAFQWTNQRTYFFFGTQYDRFNDILFQVDSGYPRPTRTSWFGCPSPGNLVAPGDLVQGGSQTGSESNVPGSQFNVVTVSNGEQHVAKSKPTYYILNLIPIVFSKLKLWT